MKLNEYFEMTGVQKRWFAKRIGIAPAQFYQVCLEKLPPPIKYWDKIIALSGGKVTLEDLASQAMKTRKNPSSDRNKEEKKEASL
jgi:hypothetical protein